jgi:hypothetical protein
MEALRFEQDVAKVEYLRRVEAEKLEREARMADYR